MGETHTLNLRPFVPPPSKGSGRTRSNEEDARRRLEAAAGDFYTGVVLTFSFDQPLFVGSAAAGNATGVPLGRASRQKVEEAAPVALSCGDRVFGPSADERRLPQGLVPLHGCGDALGLCWLFNAAASGADPSSPIDERRAPPNVLRMLLLLSHDEGGRGERVLHALPNGGRGCVAEWGDGSTADGRRLENARGEAAVVPHATPLVWPRQEARAAGPRDAAGVSYAPFRHPGDAQQCGAGASGRETPRQARYRRFLARTAAGPARRAADGETSHELELIEEETAARARARLLDRENYYSFLQTIAYARTADTVSARQILDLIADPIIALVVPTVVQVLVDVIKYMLMMAIMPPIVEAVSAPLTAPVADAMKTAQAAVPAAPAASGFREDRARRPTTAPAAEDPRVRRRRPGDQSQYMRFVAQRAMTAPASASAFADGALAGVPQEVATAVSGPIVQTVQIATGDNLRHAVNRTVVRESSRVLVTSLTQTMTPSIARPAAQRLKGAMPHLTAHRVVRPMIPFLTHSIGTVLTLAMSRKPEYDYFCNFCASHQTFCEYCHQGIANDMAVQHYTSYYASYFSKYYDSFYAELFVDVLSKQVGDTYTSTMDDEAPPGTSPITAESYDMPPEITPGGPS